MATFILLSSEAKAWVKLNGVGEGGEGYFIGRLMAKGAINKWLGKRLMGR